jgi:predicted Fe-Mo cluster-binding NifX family protein
MKAAFSIWDDRIAPVFDVARQILLVEAKSGHIISETEESLADTVPMRKVLWLAEMGANILVCGAISLPLREMIAAYGIKVIPFVAGELGEIKCAWLSGGGDIRRFTMPGCCARGQQRRRGICGINMEEFAMNGKGRGGMGKGGGQGQGRKGGPFAAGDDGACLCPQCGHHEPHERGVPCLQKQCPKCGATMIRQ